MDTSTDFPPNLSVIAASERQHARWINLNFPSDRVQISGNLKIDAVDRSRLVLKPELISVKNLVFPKKTWWWLVSLPGRAKKNAY